MNFAETCMLLLRLNVVKRVSGESMEPTLKDGGWMLLDWLAYIKKEPSRFDIVMLREPTSNIRVVKRIVGLPREVVALEADGLYVSGMKIEECYAKGTSRGSFVWRTEGGEYVVLGDNRTHSKDSRDYGKIYRSAIVGKVRVSN